MQRRSDAFGLFCKPRNMRFPYTLTFFMIIVLTTGCSKDFLKSYDKRVLGTWKIVDIDRYGFNEPDALPFKENDVFAFDSDGVLTITRAARTYHGSWDIQRVQTSDDEEVKALHINAIDFNNQQVRSEYFNDMHFTNTNRFVASIHYNTRVYVYRFLRQ